MKNKRYFKTLILILTLLFLIIIPKNAMATDLVQDKKQIDFSEAKYEIKVQENDTKNNNYIKITNIKDFEDEEFKVYYLLSNSKTETITKTTNGKPLLINDDGSAEISIDKSTDLYLYIWVLRNNEAVNLKSAYEVQRIIPNLTKRIGGLFLEDITAGDYISCNLIAGGFSDITGVTCKIGKITDNTVLKSVKDGNIKTLLQYAKSNAGVKIITVSLESGGMGKEYVNLNGLTDGAYYYAYFNTNNNSLEDVNLYYCTISENGISLHRSDQSGFKWNLTEEDENIQDDEENEDDEIILEDPNRVKINLPDTIYTNTENKMTTNYTGKYQLYYQTLTLTKQQYDELSNYLESDEFAEKAAEEMVNGTIKSEEEIVLKGLEHKNYKYSDSNWKSTTGKITYDFKNGENYFIVWGKLVLTDKNNETYYTVGMYSSEIKSTKTLQSIEITSAPTKTVYTVGEKFNSAGMKVLATYSDGSKSYVTGDCTYSPSGKLTKDTKTITISYTENGVTKTATQSIKIDTTIASGNIPYTGGTFVIIASVVAIMAVGAYVYKRNKDFRGI